MNPSFRNRVLSAVVLAAAVMGVLSCGSNSTLVSIRVTPSDPIVVNGSTMQFIASAIFSNGMIVSPWSVVTWSSTDTGVATIGANGVVTAVGPGTTGIIATDMQHPNIFSQAVLTVTNMPLAALVVTVDSPLLVAGQPAQATAEGIYADGSHPTVTSSVIWSSSNGNVASISNTQGSEGLIKAIAAGTTTITAVDLQTLISATVVLTVTPP